LFPGPHAPNQILKHLLRHAVLRVSIRSLC
jgi:hypothetical protein